MEGRLEDGIGWIA
jgi:hypothetical protein